MRAFVVRRMTEKRLLEEQLRQAQKMEAVGNLAGGVAHDFNNILTVIRSASESALAELEDGTVREKVEQIDSAAAHAAALTQQLLAFSRQQVLQPETIDLNDVIDTTCDFVVRLVGAQIVVERRLDEGLPSVRMDRNQLQQVIFDLCINARDAMPDGGRILVRTAPVVVDDAIAATHIDLEPGEYVLLEISDNGVGIDGETCRRIFDPFFTTKSEGTGLGLATVYGIVRQSGGQIYVYSEPGMGTTFRIYLPPAGERSQATVALPPPLPVLLSSRGDETILVVEDAEILRPMITKIISSNGYRVIAAANGEEAIARFDEHAGAIDLLLTNMVMPGMNVRELAECLRQKNPSLKVLFTSGYPADSSIDESIAAPGVSFIQKPYTGNELVARIRTTLA